MHSQGILEKLSGHGLDGIGRNKSKELLVWLLVFQSWHGYPSLPCRAVRSFRFPERQMFKSRLADIKDKRRTSKEVQQLRTNTTVDKLFLSCLFQNEWWCMHIFVKERKIILVISSQAPQDFVFYCSSSWELLCKWSSLSLRQWPWDLQGPPSSALRLGWEMSSERLLLPYSSKVLRAWSRSTELASPGACEKCTLSGSTPFLKQRL